MKLFSELIQQLESTNKTNARLEAIVAYLQKATEKDKLWLIALFTGKRPKRSVGTAQLRAWVTEQANIPDWLFTESYASVGDLGETISLLLPAPSHQIEKSLHQWMQEIIALQGATEEEKKNYVLEAWSGLQATERFIFNKLIGGSFRIGVSSKMLINALALFCGEEPSKLMHSVMGNWDINQTNFADLISGELVNTDLSRPYPFCLAYPLESEPEDLGNIGDWIIEHKWDGIRGQLIVREGQVFIWSRGEELVTDQFPELRDNLAKTNRDVVLDGEILAFKDGQVLNFSELQKRLNRKNITKKMLGDLPIVCFLYDLIELDGADLRSQPLQERRQILERWMAEQAPENIHLSTLLKVADWPEAATLREAAREVNAEGLMLKHKDSVFHAGRKKGDWWKWKISPMTIDAVLIYAQKGSGRRSSYYTDYTFAVRDGDNLVTIAKAYSGLTDKEIMEVSRFVNANAIEKFGPVRTVKAELVFEIAFEGISYSSRHKSGVALRFPRILRWRRDKTVNDIDHLEAVKQLIK